MKDGPALLGDVAKRQAEAIARAFATAHGQRPHPVTVRTNFEVISNDGVCVCNFCGEQLATDMLLEQAEKLLAPLHDAPESEIGALLTRVATPLNEGFDCCYMCADRLSGSVDTAQ